MHNIPCGASKERQSRVSAAVHPQALALAGLFAVAMFATQSLS